MSGRQNRQSGGKSGSDAVRVTRAIAIFGVLLILSLSLLIGGLPQLRYASANSSEVQHNGGEAYCSTGSPCSDIVSFGSGVTSGDTVVVAILDANYHFSASKITVSDTLGSWYSQATYLTDNNRGGDQGVLIYVATLTASGANSVNVTDTTGNSDALFVFIFEVSGVTLAAKETATGYGMCWPDFCNTQTSTNSTVNFLPGAFLLAMISSINQGATPGSGFSNYTFWNSNIFVEYSTSGVSTPTNFPVTMTNLYSGWLEAGIALQPIVPIVTSIVTSLVTTTSTTTETSTDTQTVTATFTTPVTTTETSVSTTSVTLPPVTTTATATITSVPPPVTLTTTEISTETTTSVSSVTTTATSTQTVAAATIWVSCAPLQLGVGKTTKCTAVAIAGYPPAGTIYFASSGGGQFGTAKCTTSASILTCTIPYTPSTAGKQQITATYSGDPNFLTVSASTTITVKP